MPVYKGLENLVTLKTTATIGINLDIVASYYSTDKAKAKKAAYIANFPGGNDANHDRIEKYLIGFGYDVTRHNSLWFASTFATTAKDKEVCSIVSHSQAYFYKHAGALCSLFTGFCSSANWARVKLADLPAGLSYKFVFAGACNSARGAVSAIDPTKKDLGKEFAEKFGIFTKVVNNGQEQEQGAYLGFLVTVYPNQTAEFGEYLFEELKKKPDGTIPTVSEAAKQAGVRMKGAGDLSWEADITYKIFGNDGITLDK